MQAPTSSNPTISNKPSNTTNTEESIDSNSKSMECSSIGNIYLYNTSFKKRLSDWIGLPMEKRKTLGVAFTAACASFMFKQEELAKQTNHREVHSFEPTISKDVRTYLKFENELDDVVVKFPFVEFPFYTHFEHPVTGIHIHADISAERRCVLFEIDHYESECDSRVLLLLEPTQVISSKSITSRKYVIRDSRHLDIRLLKQFLLVFADCLYSQNREEIGKFVMSPLMKMVDISESLRNTVAFRARYQGDKVHNHYDSFIDLDDLDRNNNNGDDNYHHFSNRPPVSISTNTINTKSSTTLSGWRSDNDSDDNNEESDRFNEFPSAQKIATPSSSSSQINERSLAKTKKITHVIVLSDEMGKRADEVKKMMAPKRKRTDEYEGQPDECIICRDSPPTTIALPCYHKLLCNACFTRECEKRASDREERGKQVRCYECRQSIQHVIVEGTGIYSIADGQFCK